MSEDSDEEFFYASQIKGKPASLSQINYFFVVVFELNVNLKNPFQCYPLENFCDDDIPSSWIRGSLEPKYRVEDRVFNCFPGKKFNVFCKVEKGKYNKYNKYNNVFQ